MNGYSIHRASFFHDYLSCDRENVYGTELHEEYRQEAGLNVHIIAVEYDVLYRGLRLSGDEESVF